MIENSKTYLWLSQVGTYLISLLLNSGLVQVFLSKNQSEEIERNSFFYKLYNGVRMFMVRIFSVLKLDKLFKGSIFKINYLWMLVTVVLSPFAPTMLVILMSVAAFLSLILRLFCNKEFELKYNSINKYIYLYALVYAVAIFASVTMKGSLYGGAVTICFVLFSIVVINGIESKMQVRIVNFLLVVGGLLVALYGFYQYLNPAKFGGSWVDQEMFEGMFRVYSTYQNPNVLGEYFLLIIPLSVASFFIAKPIFLKLFYFGATAVMMFCLVLTFSRGCYLGILVAAAVFAVLYDKRFVFLGVLVLFLLPFILPESILNRFLSIGNMEDSSTSYRVYIWMGTLAMLKDYWFSGIGPGEAAYRILYPVYAYNGISAPHAHNTFLQIICDAGVVGIAVFVMIIYQYFKTLFISYMETKDKTEKLFIIGSISSIAGFLVQSLFDYTFYNYRVMLLFWVFIGLGVVNSKYAKLKEA